MAIDFYSPAPAAKKPANDAQPPGDEFFEGGADMPPASERMTAAVEASAPSGETIAEVLDGWLLDGALVHESTGIAALDDVTGGGPAYGTRWALLGPPDAGKTGLLVQWGHDWAQRGIFVGFVAVDEESGDLVTRLAQRIGYARTDCETRDPDIVGHMREELASLPVRFYGANHSIESAAADLHRFATENTPEGKPVRCALLIDSIQTVSCNAAWQMEKSGKEVSPRAVVTANVQAVKAVAKQYRAIVVFTSEMARRAYQHTASASESTGMGDGAESRAIEYGARVQLTLRSMKGEPDRLELTPTKNKHGRANVPIYVKLDRARMTLVETDAPATGDSRGATSRKVAEDAGIALHVIATNPGVGTVDLRAKVRGGGHEVGNPALGAALEFLIAAGRIENRPEVNGKRTFPHYFAVVRGGES